MVIDAELEGIGVKLVGCCCAGLVLSPSTCGSSLGVCNNQQLGLFLRVKDHDPASSLGLDVSSAGAVPLDSILLATFHSGISRHSSLGKLVN